jgi:xanthine dehydrogenase YagS FAD-binding subunit
VITGQAYVYKKALSIDDALDALDKYGSDAVLFAGGTDLLIQMRQNTIAPICLIDVKGIPHFSDLTEENDFLEIGAAVTLKDVETFCTVHSFFPALAESARQVGAVQLRNRATLGGNLCQSMRCLYYNQSHINLFMRKALKSCFKRGGKSCYAVKWGREVSHAILINSNYCRASFGSNIAIALGALGGVVVLVKKNRSREVTIEDFYEKNGEPKIAANEIITHIKIPLRHQKRSTFLQYKANPASYTLLNIAVLLDLEDDGDTCKSIRTWLGGVAAQPYRAKNVEEYLNERRLSKEIIQKASQLLFQGIDVSEATMRFKVAKARVLCREALMKASGQE